MILNSQIIITSQIENTILELENLRDTEHIVEIISPAIASRLQDAEPCDYRVQRVISEKETFRVEDAKVVIEKAYMASKENTIIILAAETFSPLIQNKLLKVIEEPPKNKNFILITERKSTILDTIKSRLPLTVISHEREEIVLNLNIENLSLEDVYIFTQQHKRTNAKSMKSIIESISKKVMMSQKYELDSTILTLFSNVFLALDVGSPPQFILNTLLLKLLARKRKI